MVPEITTLLLQQAKAFSYAQYSGSHSLPPPQNYNNNNSGSSNGDGNSGNINSNPSAAIQTLSPCQILLIGIESHVCVLQTATDLLALGHRVYVLADGVSSCHAGERVIALERLRQEGCVVTTSESVIFEMVGDARKKEFRDVAALIKRWKRETGSAVERLCGSGMALGAMGGMLEGGDDGEGAEGGRGSGGASSRL